MTGVAELLETVCRSAVAAVFTPPFSTVVRKSHPCQESSISAKYADRSLCLTVHAFLLGTTMGPDGTHRLRFELWCRRTHCREDAEVGLIVETPYHSNLIWTSDYERVTVCSGFAARFYSLARKAAYQAATVQLL